MRASEMGEMVSGNVIVIVALRPRCPLLPFIHTVFLCSSVVSVALSSREANAANVLFGKGRVLRSGVAHGRPRCNSVAAL